MSARPVDSVEFELPRIYAPKMEWFNFTAFFLLVSGTYILRSVGIGHPEIPWRFTIEGTPSLWVARSWFTLCLPTIYGLVGAGILLWFAARTAPPQAERVIPPTPLPGFIDHLARATAASLMQLTAAYVAFIGMSAQIGINYALTNQLIRGGENPFNVSWALTGGLIYLFYAGWILLLFNRDAKRGQYGEIALEGGVEIPPAVTPERRRTKRPSSAAPPTTPRSGHFVD